MDFNGSLKCSMFPNKTFVFIIYSSTIWPVFASEIYALNWMLMKIFAKSKSFHQNSLNY